MGLLPSNSVAAEEAQRELRRFATNVTEEIGNVGLASDLTGPAYLVYGRHRYRVPPVPYKLGIELEEIRLKMDQLTTDEMTVEQNVQLGELYTRAVALFPKLVKPTFGIQILLWRVASNPFRNASPLDVATLIYFFCSCRMRSDLRLEKTSLARKSRQSTMQLIT